MFPQVSFSILNVFHQAVQYWRMRSNKMARRDHLRQLNEEVAKYPEPIEVSWRFAEGDEEGRVLVYLRSGDFYYDPSMLVSEEEAEIVKGIISMAWDMARE